MKIFTTDELKEIFRKHLLWLEDDDGGERADLSNADLSNADLRYADLRYADLSNANLRYANLRNADLSNANLSNADLSNANLRNANLILIGQDIRGYLFWAFVGDSGTVEILAGCRHFVGISAARQHWSERHGGDVILHEDCLSLVDRCERMAKVRGWNLEPK